MEQISPLAPRIGVTQSVLDSMNVEQARQENKIALDEIGGVDGLAGMLGVNLETGLTTDQVLDMRDNFGYNKFPESPMDGYIDLLIIALSDTTLLILIAAAAVSLVVGTWENAEIGWLDGTAIFGAVFLVSNISAGNDYSKQFQFRKLEEESQADEQTSVIRNGVIERINPVDIVVGDVVVLQSGDAIPADCIICDHNEVKSNESSLTGEPDDLKKNRDKDPFLLSACTITDGNDAIHALALGIGPNSQWGKIKANLVQESVNTPLQDKLEIMTANIGYVGMLAAAATLIALIIMIFTDPDMNQEDYLIEFIHAFIIAITIVVVAIPEGLPLAVTIALAYSTKKMYADQCLIRVLAACETMGNATNICSDKTGTLTENQMTVTEGWFADIKYDADQFDTKSDKANGIPATIKQLLAEQISINRTAYLVYKDKMGKDLYKPNIIGNKTEGALIFMIRSWGFDYEEVHKQTYDQAKDKVFAFNSGKKRSTAVVHKKDETVVIYCKGASEWILKDCTHFLDQQGTKQTMTSSKRADLDKVINGMASNALRTLCLAHKVMSSVSELPGDWTENPPDSSDLILDCIVGIIDPLRSDVKDAVYKAQRAGVTVRMVTGDNIITAQAIAKQCGIMTTDGIAVEGPVFRKMTPADVDRMLPKLQVMARSSPDDKYLLVTRLNGYGIPSTREEWEEKFQNVEGVDFEKDKYRLLPGFKEEWDESRPFGGDVVGVTGDGTNDAPALKAADVGLAMGITGTKVAQHASDIIIVDDKFSSIIKAILWGRAVYDSVRKFLQFQLTVNIVALLLVFIGAVTRFEALNSVQMLWVNLVMDTMGALALATELPTPELLERKPYKRSAGLISRPMWRNILVQSTFQLTLTLILMFAGQNLWNIPRGKTCGKYTMTNEVDPLTVDPVKWNAYTGLKIEDPTTNSYVTCADFVTVCGDAGYTFAGESHGDQQYCLGGWNNPVGTDYKYMLSGFTVNGADVEEPVEVEKAFSDLDNFEDTCMEKCEKYEGYYQNTLLFNAFIFSQIFNEYNARVLGDDKNMLKGVESNFIFLSVTVFSVICQILMVYFGGQACKTQPITITDFLITVGLGAISLPVGVFMRFIPVEEDPDSFFSSEILGDGSGPSKDPDDLYLMKAQDF